MIRGKIRRTNSALPRGYIQHLKRQVSQIGLKMNCTKGAYQTLAVDELD